MPRVVGVDIPNNKPTAIALRYIFGVGPTLAVKICADLKINPDKRANLLTREEISAINAYVEKHIIVEGELRRQQTTNIKRLMDIRCYRGIRHIQGLPVRGQRTRTNARTRKGKRKTVARKASVKELR
ncbi:MAG: 30S ribosomal protein S13 [Planctomycetota bacterium]